MSKSSNSKTEQARLNRQLLQAAWDDDVTRARQLIGDGADVNHQDDSQQSAFLIAASEGHLNLLKLTLDHGADVHAHDSYDGTALIRAAERGHANIIKRLLDTDIKVNHVNNLGWTALLEAVILGDGTQPYQHAIHHLLDHGAGPAITDHTGQTALQHAKTNQQTAVTQILRHAD